MVLRVVLFRLKPGITDDHMRALLATLGAARQTVGSIQRVHIGKRIPETGGYEMEGGAIQPYEATRARFDYAAVFEFADRAALEAYLAHPSQQQLKLKFAGAVEAAVAYDYEV